MSIVPNKYENAKLGLPFMYLLTNTIGYSLRVKTLHQPLDIKILGN